MLDAFTIIEVNVYYAQRSSLTKVRAYITSEFCLVPRDFSLLFRGSAEEINNLPLLISFDPLHLAFSSITHWRARASYILTSSSAASGSMAVQSSFIIGFNLA